MAQSATIKAILAKEAPLLQISFGDTQVKENGQHLPRATATPEPSISFPSAAQGKKYFVINVDLDAPFISLPFMSPILHWAKHDLTASADGTLTNESGKSLAFWAPPGPPPGAAPHRYVFCLYEQPEGFDSEGLAPGGVVTRFGRMRFDFEGFEKKFGLGSVAAGGWFVSN
jgi:phosphatidylethanolamine-binding protein (PEBP) family uncharacterized protein